MNADETTVMALVNMMIHEKVIGKIDIENPISLLMLNIASKDPLFTYLSRSYFPEVLSEHTGNSVQHEWYRMLMTSSWKDSVDTRKRLRKTVAKVS